MRELSAPLLALGFAVLAMSLGALPGVTGSTPVHALGTCDWICAVGIATAVVGLGLILATNKTWPWLVLMLGGVLAVLAYTVPGL